MKKLPPQLPNSLSLPFIEELYERYVRDPTALPEHWQNYFKFESDGHPPDTQKSAGQERVDQLIHNYRVRGHRVAQVDPLGLRQLAAPELDYKFYGFSERDLDRSFFCGSLCPQRTLTLREILDRLRTTYCRTIGVQFMHIDDP